ncbi:protein YIPF1-like [Liolophura sinensis]|uniref:protein YIPF1-like n=1 Tax=Liolophura sinensis TaxID=3198878 RepID=UPI003158AE4A
MVDELAFQDIPHDLEADGGELKGKSQTHTFTDFPHNAGSDDEEGDKVELLEGEKKPPSFWSFDYYQEFFDVDTREVLHRILGSMLPLPKRNFLRSKIRPNPDLYGPFWICATLVFTTAIAGNLSNYLQTAGKGYHWNYEFNKVTIAATAIYCYWWLIPTALFGVLWWRGSQAGYSFLEIICVYGYSLAIYIPISILWVIHVPVLQWILVIVGTCLSGGVLLLTFWPAVREDNKKVAVGIMIGIFIIHALLAAGFLFYFFQVSSMKGGAVTVGTNISSVVTMAPSKLHNNAQDEEHTQSTKTASEKDRAMSKANAQDTSAKVKKKSASSDSVNSKPLLKSSNRQMLKS